MGEQTLEQVLRNVNLKFTSGNSIPIERASVTATEWSAIRHALLKYMALTERTFPIMKGPRIPWRAIAPFEEQARRNHSQSLERLAERGGLSPCEAVAIMENREWHRMDAAAALKRLNELTSVPTDEKIIELFESTLSNNPEAYLTPGQTVYQVTQDELLGFSKLLLK